MSNLIDYEVVIVGAGVIGLAVAKELQEKITLNQFLFLDKNSNFGQETSSRNSQVTHSGIFNTINSKEFRFCVER